MRIAKYASCQLFTCFCYAALLLELFHMLVSPLTPYIKLFCLKSFGTYVHERILELHTFTKRGGTAENYFCQLAVLK